ncbi:unnamed protein product [Oppiella nova]|uniref:Cystatin domain-containing protein n=1 Tax=Oppiella nova TaxID=334625 RepID=A0A7R9MD94_9ACAR|nr:unnamed protein product [Oppiella nova]CAG2175225.1 unnamed protein product [Oppiella nova]
MSKLAVIAVIVWTTCLVGGSGDRMTGGVKQVSVDSDNVKNLADLAVDRYNKGSNAINYKQLITIKEAKHQVVAGSKWFITFTIGEIQCPKNGRNPVADVHQCPHQTTTRSRDVFSDYMAEGLAEQY